MYKIGLIVFILFILSFQQGVAQTVIIDEGFDDGDFTNNPAWSDPENKHVVNGSNRLQLDAPEVTDEAAITTPSDAAYGEWEAFVRLDFETSGGNLARFYILSDTQSLKGDVNGYYIQVGGSDDQINLYRQDGGSSTPIISSAVDLIMGDNPVIVRVRATRDLNGDWELFADTDGGNTYTSMGTVNDDTYTTSSYIGFLSDYTSTRHDLFQYDDIVVTKVTPPLEIQDVIIQDDSTIDVEFNLDLDPSSVDATDFSLDNGVGSPGTVSLPTPDVVRLSYSSALPSNDYTLTVNDVDDSDGNTIDPNSAESFILYGTFQAGDVIINEFMYDFPSGQEEYVEIKNLSNKYLDLQGWQIGDETGNGTISSGTVTLEPNGFLAVSPDTSALFNVYGSRPYVESGTLPSFNNDGDVVKVLTDTDAIVDSLRYTSAWGGNDVSLERRSDSAPSIYRENFGDSPNPNGGTPGIANEVADDTTPPDLNDLIITNGQTLDLDFSERLDNSSATNTANYAIDNGINITNAQQTAGDSVRLALSSSLQNGTEYQLTISSQEDIFGNTAAPIDTSFTYYVISEPDSGDIFINEFMYDPPGGSSEYIELYNPTSQSFDLNGWTINDNTGTPQTITNSRFVVPPDSFVVIAPDNSLQSSYPDIALVTMGSDFPSLNNNGDDIVLRDSTGQRLDSLKYESDWGGEEIALERRTTDVAPIQANFGNSPDGFGTPGSANEIPDDTTPPDLQSFSVLSSQSLRFVFTEEIDTQSGSDPSNYSISGGLSINSATAAQDTAEVTLSGPLQNNTQYTVTINGVEDLFGNAVNNRDTTFTYYEVSPADSGDIFINEFTYDPPEGSTEYIELYNSSSKSLDLQNWTINDNTGNRQTITNSQRIVPPDSYVVLAPDQTLQDENPDMELVMMGSSFPSLNNSGDAIVLRDETGERLDSLSFTADWGGDQIALERRTTDVAPVEANFGDSPNGFGTPGDPNEVGQDNSPPTLSDLDIVSNQTIRLGFSEGLRDGPAANPDNYSLDNGIDINDVQQTAPDSVQLGLSSPLQDATQYQLSVINQQDIFGNTNASIDTSFTYFEPSPADSGDIFINEFTYDPPEGSTEYVELFNTSPKSLDLEGWTINDNTGSKRIITDSQYIVPPGSYVVLAPDQSLLNENPDAEIITLGNSFPSLNNSGDDIVIRDASGERLDSLSYTPDWGGDQVALERRTTDAPPVQANFGDAPNDFGTPGDPNEIGSDDMAPALEQFAVIDNQSLQFIFSEQVDEQSAENTSNYAITGGISISGATLSGSDTIVATLSDPLQNNTQYTATVDGVEDLFGNILTNRDTTFTYFETSAADSGDIFINEFTFDPPEGSTEYIELYNTTNRSFDLNGWTINDNTGNRRTITDGQFIVPPDSFVVIAPDQTLKTDYPDIALVAMGSDFPSLNNSGDDIVLRNADGQRLDSLQYSASWGGNNIALERRSTDVEPIRANFGDAPNGFGTPGSANQIEEDTTPPELQAFAINGNQSLEFIFSEQVDETSATDPDNYALSGSISITDATLAGSDTVRVSLSGSMQNDTEYTATVSGVQDLFGNEMGQEQATFTYYEISEADSADIFINEFMYDPPSGQTEYVELYNPTDKSLNIQNWTLNDNTGNRRIITRDQYIVPPDSFVVIAPDETLLQDYPGLDIVTMGSSFPSFNNTGDDIVVRDEVGMLLDSLRYTSAWGGDEVALERRTISVDPIQANFGDAPNEFGTPGSRNQILPDNQAPELNTVRVIDQSTLQLIFSETIRSETTTDQDNYSISPARGIQLISSVQDTVTLYLSQDLESERSYQLSVSGLQDVFGNTIAPTTREVIFVSFSQAQPGDIVINEILYSRAGAGSPEFVELYNRTEQNFDLSGWELGDASNTATLDPGVQLRAGDYIVLTDNTALANLVDNGVYLSNFPSLNDDEDAVYIQTESGVRIDSLFYTNAFGGDEDGKSAERKDPGAASNDPANFATSVDDEGSTPGEQNSVFQLDDSAPEITFSRIFANGDIEVRFSEFISITPDLTFALDGQELTIDSFDPDNGDIIYLNSPSGTAPGSNLTVTAQNLQDVSGNVTATTEKAVAQPLNSGDVVINEILFDPLSDSDDNQPDQSEYIELRNIRDYAVSLEDITLHDAPDEDGEVRTLAPVSTRSKFIPAQGTALIYAEDETSTFEQSKVAQFFDLQNPEMSTIIRVDRSSLSLASTDDAIYLSGQEGVEIDSVFYDESWHNPNLVDTDGIALERINPFGPSNDESNWGSSTNERGGTPNRQNTLLQISDGNTQQETGISFDPNPFSPDDDGDEDNLFINYKLDQADYLMTVQIFDRYGRLVRELADSKAAGLEGSLIWDGLKDDGTRNRIGIYIVIFKAFDSTGGENKTFKKTVVLARRLN